MTTVAVIGTSGTLGAPLLEALSNPVTGNFKYPIKAVTSKEKASTDKVQFVQKSLDDPELAKELAGTDVIISLLAPSPDLLANVEKLLAEVKPKVYIPSEFGTDVAAAQAVFPGFLGIKYNHAANVEKIGGIKVVKVNTGFFKIPPFLTELFDHIGLDAKNNTLTYLDNKDNQVVFSTAKDIANSVVVISSIDASKLQSQYDIQSGAPTLNEFAAKYEKDHNVKLTEIKKDKATEINAAKEDWKTNGFSGDKFLTYLFITFSSGPGFGIGRTSNDNEKLNPGQSLWKYDSY